MFSVVCFRVFILHQPMKYNRVLSFFLRGSKSEAFSSIGPLLGVVDIRVAANINLPKFILKLYDPVSVT